MGKVEIIVKPGVSFEDFKDVNPSLIIVLGWFFSFCEKNGLDCVITSIKEHVDGRVTATHEDGRALDASVQGFSDGDIIQCIEFMNKNVGHFGAYSKSDNKQRVIIYHDVGLGRHFHLQVKR